MWWLQLGSSALTRTRAVRWRDHARGPADAARGALRARRPGAVRMHRRGAAAVRHAQDMTWARPVRASCRPWAGVLVTVPARAGRTAGPRGRGPRGRAPRTRLNATQAEAATLNAAARWAARFLAWAPESRVFAFVARARVYISRRVTPASPVRPWSLPLANTHRTRRADRGPRGPRCWARPVAIL